MLLHFLFAIKIFIRWSGSFWISTGSAVKGYNPVTLLAPAPGQLPLTQSNQAQGWKGLASCVISCAICALSLTAKSHYILDGIYCCKSCFSFGVSFGLFGRPHQTKQCFCLDW